MQSEEEAREKYNAIRRSQGEVQSEEAKCNESEEFGRKKCNQPERKVSLCSRSNVHIAIHLIF
ncbi:hypothetical protein A2U01_0110748, partial [Trifolium medium]|nr:hypothetical protein [Trifolium medium]